MMQIILKIARYRNGDHYVCSKGEGSSTIVNKVYCCKGEGKTSVQQKRAFGKWAALALPGVNRGRAELLITRNLRRRKEQKRISVEKRMGIPASFSFYRHPNYRIAVVPKLKFILIPVYRREQNNSR